MCTREWVCTGCACFRGRRKVEVLICLNYDDEDSVVLGSRELVEQRHIVQQSVALESSRPSLVSRV